ncbi:MAG: hypothetical protein E6X57_01060, partial [Clostridioides difficile]|nr:hypothetical protein [Clostridioides difficile]
GNLDKIINNNIKKFNQSIGLNRVYLKMLKKCAYQESVTSISRTIKKEALFKSKKELFAFSEYLKLDINKRLSYNQILRKISRYIYYNRSSYAQKYVVFKRGDEEYLLEPEKIKDELISSYRSKTREDMRSIAKLLDIEVEDDYNAEDIRKKVINYIIKEKLKS